MSTSCSGELKICLEVSKLWSAQGWSTDFCFRGDNYLTKEVRVFSLACDDYWSSSSSLPNIIKLSQTVWELWSAQDFSWRGDNYITKIVRVISLAATHLLVLLIIPTKYCQNISKGIKVTEGTRMHLRTDRRMDGRTPC